MYSVMNSIRKGVWFTFMTVFWVFLFMGCSNESSSSGKASFTLDAHGTSSSQVRLSWTYSAGNETGFHIERLTSGADFVEIAQLDKGTVSYMNTDLSAGTTYTYRVCAYNAGGLISCSEETSCSTLQAATSAIIIDHTSTKLTDIPIESINQAKSDLHIAYGHTSHGSQLVTGMTGLYSWKGSLYAFNNHGTDGALDLRDTPFSGASDLGNPDRTAWADATRTYLDANPDINVIMWSWCGQVSAATEVDIDTYLSLMSDLEADYPDVKFVYMTGHLDGSGHTGNLHVRNEQIRAYCRDNNKILYDFADIETYNTDGVYFGDKHPNDACDYDSNGDDTLDANWAIEWQNSHTLDVDWYNCTSAHSQPLNANLKAYAAWWLWACLAGWDGQ